MAEEKPGEINVKQANKFAKIFSPIMEDGKASIGRVMLVSTFLLAISMWFQSKEIPQTMLTILITLVSYVVASKTVGTIKDVAQKVKDTKEIVANIKK